MAKDHDMVTLLTDPNPADIAIASDQLDQAGINYHVRNESYGGLYGSSTGRLQRFAEPQLVVFRKDFMRAAEVVGVPVPDGFENEVKRERRPGLVGWIRWIAGLD